MWSTYSYADGDVSHRGLNIALVKQIREKTNVSLESGSMPSLDLEPKKFRKRAAMHFLAEVGKKRCLIDEADLDFVKDLDRNVYDTFLRLRRINTEEPCAPSDAPSSPNAPSDTPPSSNTPSDTPPPSNTLSPSGLSMMLESTSRPTSGDS
jgi:hypothetical protein